MFVKISSRYWNVISVVLSSETVVADSRFELILGGLAKQDERQTVQQASQQREIPDDTLRSA